MFLWEPAEGRCCHCLCTAIVPRFWFSTEHLWILVAPFWLLTDDIETEIVLCVCVTNFTESLHIFFALFIVCVCVCVCVCLYVKGHEDTYVMCVFLCYFCASFITCVCYRAQHFIFCPWMLFLHSWGKEPSYKALYTLWWLSNMHLLFKHIYFELYPCSSNKRGTNCIYKVIMIDWKRQLKLFVWF